MDHVTPEMPLTTMRGVPEIATVGQLRKLLKDLDDDTKLVIAPTPDVNGWTSRLLAGLGDLNNAPDGGSDGTKVLYLNETCSHEDEVSFSHVYELEEVPGFPHHSGADKKHS